MHSIINSLVNFFIPYGFVLANDRFKIEYFSFQVEMIISLARLNNTNLSYDDNQIDSFFKKFVTFTI